MPRRHARVLCTYVLYAGPECMRLASAAGPVAPGLRVSRPITPAAASIEKTGARKWPRPQVADASPGRFPRAEEPRCTPGRTGRAVRHRQIACHYLGVKSYAQANSTDAAGNVMFR